MSFLRTSGLDWYFNMSLGNVPNNILCDFRLTYTHASNQSHCILAMCSATLSLLAQCTVVAIFKKNSLRKKNYFYNIIFVSLCKTKCYVKIVNSTIFPLC